MIYNYNWKKEKVILIYNMHIYDINNRENILFYAIYINYVFYRKYYLFSFKDLHYIYGCLFIGIPTPVIQQ